MTEDKPGMTFLHPSDERRRRRKVYGTAHWERVRRLALERDGYRCHWCGAPANIGDHLTDPLEDWEHRYTLSNIVAACRSCNAKRSRPNYGEQPRRDPMTVRSGYASRPAPGARIEAPRIVPVGSSPALSVPYHRHRWGPQDWQVILLGNMSMRWDGDGCPPACDRKRYP